jgi:2-polyprenyl-3-methyl-5-hydroxy-6-metoxy-1,4-benzoquinol methylase
MPVELRTCHICGGDQYQPHYTFDDCAIVRCKQCDFMWLNPQPTEADVEAVYDDSYFVNSHFMENNRDTLYGYVDYILERVNKQVQYQHIVRRARSMLQLNATPPRWMDIGCGLGYLLDCAYDYGFDVFGTELNRSAVAQLKRRYNYTVDCVPITDPSFDGQHYDVISMTDVIEHLHNPRQMIRRMQQLTCPGGLAIITTMDSDSLSSRLLGKRLEDFRRTREHLYFFSRPTLTRLLEEEGFEVAAIRSIGHTFELGFLAERMRLISAPLGRLAQAIVNGSHLQHIQLYIDPHTKMIVYARRKP